MQRFASCASTHLVRAANTLVLSLTRCPGCDARPPGPRGACRACWSIMLDPVRTADVIALGRYGGALGAILRKAKFGGASVALDALASHLSVLLDEAGVAHLPVVPVPSHRSRRRRRGDDPSWRLARAAAGARAVRALVRHRNDGPQSRTRRDARERNVAGAFTLDGAAREAIAGVPVVLLDDVLTTGATVRACRAALAEADVSVRIVAVAALA